VTAPPRALRLALMRPLRDVLPLLLVLATIASWLVRALLLLGLSAPTPTVPNTPAVSA
jgi:hypothetical protein